MNRQYLGNSLYAHYNGFHIVLCTDNGHGPTNELFLDNKVIENLLTFIEETWDIKIKMEAISRVDEPRKPYGIFKSENERGK
jgi:hypothetical protein